MKNRTPHALLSKQFRAFSVFLLTFSFAFTADELQSSPPGSQLGTLKLKLEVALEDLAKPDPRLEEQYQKQLKELEANFIRAGNLESVVLVREEQKKPGKVEADKFPELQRLQKIYLAEHEKRRSALVAERVSVYKKYEKAASDLAVSLTKGGDIDGAIASKAEAERVATLIKRGKLTLVNPGFIGHVYRKTSPIRGNTTASKMVFHEDGKATETWSSGDRAWNWDMDEGGVVTIWKGASKEKYSNLITWTFNKDCHSADVYSRYHRTTKKAIRE